MLDFLTSYGIEILLILYGIVTTFLNVLTFRRTKKIVNGTSVVSSSTNDKLLNKIDKAKIKLEKLIEKAVASEKSVSEGTTNGSSE